jgi:MoaA/NifB/PqqE/SkfB family radical SAM enzyme
MCPRNSWVDEILGDMAMPLFDELLTQIQQINTIETLFFGGIAEPLSHPDLVEMIRKAKAIGLQVEMISNGSMLDEEIIEKLLLAGLDTLWVSVEGAHHDSYGNLVGEDGLLKTKANLLAFNVLRRKINPEAKLGLAFVAMRSTIPELPEIIDLAHVMGVHELKISNVIPYTREMQGEMLYDRSLSTMGFREGIKNLKTTLISMPILDFDILPPAVIRSLLRPGRKLKLGENLIERRAGHCKFIDEDSLFVRWDGEVSPCMAMLHRNTTYLHDVEREISFCSYGNLAKMPLGDIWENPDYVAFRSRIKAFDFSPCTVCGACSFVENNEEDCFGNVFPSCGGCLWAEGFAQCP